MKAVFLDRDGTTIVDPPDLRVDGFDDLHLFAETIAALTELSKMDYGVFLITNQAGIAEGRLNELQFHEINDRFIKMVEPSGVKFLKTYMCPHSEDANCDCRKPKPGMLLQAAQEFDIDLNGSWMIGDRQSDILAGINAGTKTILVETGNSPVVSPEANFTAPNLLKAIEYIKNHDS